MTLEALSVSLGVDEDSLGEKGYTHKRLLEKITTGIYECNAQCKCSKTCCNRLVQEGLKYPLQLFKTADKGWGVRTLVGYVSAFGSGLIFSKFFWREYRRLNYEGMYAPKLLRSLQAAL